VTVPLHAYQDAPAKSLAGKIVIDTTNYYPNRDGVIEELENGSTIAGELLQKHLPQARTVEGLNNIWFEHLKSMARPTGSPDRFALPITGDDPTAKQAVTELFNSLGYHTVDASPLVENWCTQGDTPAYGAFQKSGPPPGTPAGVQTVREALAAAKPISS
jgi:predicted dinucleotide-binding enzyme